MPGRDRVANHLEHLGAEIGVPLHLDESGVCVIEYGIGEECVVAVPEPGEAVLFYAPLAMAVGDDREGLIEEALSLNLYGVETDGCTLGLDRNSNTIVLSCARPVEGLDEVSFRNTLTSFMLTAERLRPRLQRATTRPTPSDATPHPAHMLHLRG